MGPSQRLPLLYASIRLMLSVACASCCSSPARSQSCAIADAALFHSNERFRGLLSICAANVDSRKVPFAITVGTWMSLLSTSAELASLLSASCLRQFLRPSLCSTGRRSLPAHASVSAVICEFCCDSVTAGDHDSGSQRCRGDRLNDVPRSITWDEVRRMLEAVERRAIRGRRDYAILLLLVTYGLRAHEVARLTLDDVDWKRERLQVLARKARHATVHPLAGGVAEAIIDAWVQSANAAGLRVHEGQIGALVSPTRTCFRV